MPACILIHDGGSRETVGMEKGTQRHQRRNEATGPGFQSLENPVTGRDDSSTSPQPKRNTSWF